MTCNHFSDSLRRSFVSRQFAKDFAYYGFAIVSWIPAAIFFNGHVGELTWIHGASMYPYLNTGYNRELSKDICWNSKWNPKEGLQRGMIVSFRSPSHPEVVSIKRIIAVEGDKVIPRAPYPHPVATIPANHVWVEGDNRDTNQSLDSNHYGPISISLVTGKVTYILSPWRSFGPIRWWEFKGKTKVIRGRREDAHQWD